MLFSPLHTQRNCDKQKRNCLTDKTSSADQIRFVKEQNTPICQCKK